MSETKYVYLLLLENSKYYVGYSRNVQERVESHRQSSGPVWTRQYEPIEILKTWLVSPGWDEKELENYITRKIAAKHGHENVRGGRWIKQPPLPAHTFREDKEIEAVLGT